MNFLFCGGKGKRLKVKNDYFLKKFKRFIVHPRYSLKKGVFPF